MLDATDKMIINTLQGGLPVTERPFAQAAEKMGLDEQDLLSRLKRLLDDGVLSRFGPMYNAERMGGAFCLCAMAVPEERFEAVAAQVNAHQQVAHNYRRDHALNMWFVLATETPADIATVAAAIMAETGCKVYLFPKLQEYFIGLQVTL